MATLISMATPKTAPGDLELIRRLVNTYDVEDGSDDLGDPGVLRAWLAGAGLLDPDERLTAADLRQVVAVREALRKLLLANNGVPLDADAVDTLNAAAARAELRARFVD